MKRADQKRTDHTGVPKFFRGMDMNGVEMTRNEKTCFEAN